MMPDLSQLAQGAGAGAAQDEGGETGGDPVSILQDMLQLADQYRGVEPDEEDKAQMEQARTILQKLLAKDQSEKDGLLQGKASPGALRRVLGGGGYQ